MSTDSSSGLFLEDLRTAAAAAAGATVGRIRNAERLGCRHAPGLADRVATGARRRIAPGGVAEVAADRDIALATAVDDESAARDDVEALRATVAGQNGEPGQRAAIGERIGLAEDDPTNGDRAEEGNVGPAEHVQPVVAAERHGRPRAQRSDEVDRLEDAGRGFGIAADQDRHRQIGVEAQVGDVADQVAHRRRRRERPRSRVLDIAAERDAAGGAAGAAAGQLDGVARFDPAGEADRTDEDLLAARRDPADRHRVAARAQRAAGIVERRADAGAAPDLVDARPRHAAGDRDRVADHRHDDPVAVLQPHRRRRADADQAVEIHHDAAAAADDPDVPQRPRPANAAGQRERRADVGHRRQVVLARPVDLAADEYRDRPHRPERHEHLGAEQGAFGRGLDLAADGAERAAGGIDRRQGPDHDPPLAIDPHRAAVVGAALELDDEVVADTDDV